MSRAGGGGSGIGASRRGRSRTAIPGVVLAVLVAALAAAAWWGIPRFDSALNPDGISYLGAAEHLAAGRFKEATTAYWSPAYSWLLAPFVAAGLDGLLAARVLALLATLWLAVASWSLARRLGLRTATALPVVVAVCAIGVAQGFRLVTPDLLAGCVVLAFLQHESRRADRAWVARGAAAGILVGVGYLVKLYLLPALFLLLAVLHALHWLRMRGRRKEVLRRFAVGAACAAVVVGAWSAALYLKYGRLTLGTAGSYNLDLRASGSEAQPMVSRGLFRPPHPSAYSVWDDPGAVVSTVRRDVDENETTRRSMLAAVPRNVPALGRLVGEWSVLAPFAVLAGLFLFAWRRRGRRWRTLDLLLVTLVLYPSGYVLTHVEERFFLPLQVVCLLTTAFLADRLLAPVARRPAWRSVGLAILVAASYVATPAKRLADAATAAPESRRLRATAVALGRDVPRGSTVASDGEWGRSLNMAYFGKWSYVGALPPHGSSDEWSAQLREFAPEYVLVWDPTSLSRLPTAGEPLGPSDGPRLYPLRAP